MKKDKGYSSFVLKLMLVCTILILGSCIIFAITPRFMKNVLNIDNKDQLSPEQKLINQLYGYVTYGRDLEPMYYFLKNDRLTSDTVDGLAKVRYAFQLVTEEDILDMNDNSFEIAGSKYQSYIEQIFGIGTNYKKDKPVTLYVNQIYNNAIISISYNKDKDTYTVTKINGFINNQDNKIKLFYTKLDGYNIDNANNIITIKEKVIYTEPIYDDKGTVTTINVYKDNRHSNIIDEIKNPNNKLIKTFSIDNYLNDASTVTYTFKKDVNDNYYFDSSIIEKED